MPKFNFKWFGNDMDGLSLPDFVGGVVFVMWAIVTGWIAVKMFMGELNPIMVDFYSVFCWVPLGVIGGLFGGAMVNSIGARYKGPMNTYDSQEKNNQYGGGSYNDRPSI